VAGKNRELVDHSVSAKDLPARTTDPPVNLPNHLPAVTRLEQVAIPFFGMPKARVDFIAAHEVEIVRCREEELSCGFGDTTISNDLSLKGRL